MTRGHCYNLLEKVKFACIEFRLFHCNNAEILIEIYPCLMAKICVAQSSQLLGISCANQPITSSVLHIKWKSNLSECIFYGSMQMGQLEQL